MTAKSRLSTILAIALAVMVVAAAPAASAPTIDTDPLDETSTVSEWQDGTTISNFTASPNKTSTVQFNATTGVEGSGNDTAVYVYDGQFDDYLAAMNESQPTVVNWAAGQDAGHFNMSLNHSALADVERTPGENVTLTVSVDKNHTLDDPATNNTNFTIYAEATQGFSVERINDSEADGDLATITADTPLNSSWTSFAASDNTDVELDDMKVNGTATEVQVLLEDTEAATDFADAANDTVPVPWVGGQAESGDRMFFVSMKIDDQNVPVYYEEAPEDAPDTYAVYDTDIGGLAGVKATLGEDNFDDADDVDVSIKAGTGVDRVVAALTAYSSSMVPGTIIGFGSLAVLPLAAVRHEPRERFREQSEE